MTSETSELSTYHESLRHSISSEDEEEEDTLAESTRDHQRIMRAEQSFKQLSEATLAYATSTNTLISYTPARLEQLRQWIVEEMEFGNERLAHIHFCALIYMMEVPRLQVHENPMKHYLEEQKTLNYDFFHYARHPVSNMLRRLEQHFEHCVRLSRLVCHEWTHLSPFVAILQEQATATIEVPNPAYQEMPTDVITLLHMPKRRKVELPMMQQQVERSATNDDFRFVQLAFFYEFRHMITFAEAIDAAVAERVQCGWNEAQIEMNNVGWMTGLLRNYQAPRILIPMQDNIHQFFIYPGNVRQMQLSLNYDISLISAGVVSSTIQSETYMPVANQLAGNMPLLWADMATVSRNDPAKEAILAWDVRSGVLLFHFYLLHVLYTGKKAEEHVFPISIYTIRRGRLDRFFFHRLFYTGCLLLFRRCAYLCHEDGRIICYEGYHAVEQGLKAWVLMKYGAQSQLAHLMDLLHIPSSSVETLPVAQIGLSSASAQIPNSGVASNLARGSIFSSTGN